MDDQGQSPDLTTHYGDLHTNTDRNGFVLYSGDSRLSVVTTIVDSPRSTVDILDEKNLHGAGQETSINEHTPKLCNQCNARSIVDEEAGICHHKEISPDKSNIVTWEGANDPHKPMNWSKTKKWMTVVVTSLMSFMVSFSASVFSAAVNVTGVEFGVSSEVMLLGVALFMFGFAAGHMIWAPASELYGRLPPIWTGMLGFCIFQIPVAVAQNLETIFICRFLAGLFGSAPFAIISGMYFDFLKPVDRGIALSVFIATVFSALGAGPIVGSFITDSSLGWRWTAWITLIFGAALIILCFLTIEESFEPVLLKNKALRLRHETKDFTFHARAEEEPAHASAFVQKYVTKPIKMIFMEPILMFMTIYISFVFGVLYLAFEAYPIAFVYNRGWSPGIGSLPFLGVIIGIIIACIIVAIWSVKFVGTRLAITKELNPEDRLPTMILGSLLLPAGLFCFAWTSDPNITWVPQVISSVFIGCGIILVYFTGIVYLVDVYLFHANSAIAINTLIRSLVSAGFPMFANDMFGRLGVKWGAVVLGSIGIALIPFPLIFWKYGKKIRSWSRFAFVLPPGVT